MSFSISYLDLIKISLLCGYVPLKEGIGEAKEEEIGGQREGDFTYKTLIEYYSSILSSSPIFSQHHFGNHMDLKTTCRPITSILYLTTQIHIIHLGSPLGGLLVTINLLVN
jgi:hypothetical protein